MASPTQRSLAYLRKQGWTACIGEKYNGFARIRQDLLGFGDILACRLNEYGGVPQIALVQTTTLSNMAARRQKILGLETYWRWKSAEGWVLLHGWAKKGARGKRKVWTLTEEIL